MTSYEVKSTEKKIYVQREECIFYKSAGVKTEKASFVRAACTVERKKNVRRKAYRTARHDPLIRKIFTCYSFSLLYYAYKVLLKKGNPLQQTKKSLSN